MPGIIVFRPIEAEINQKESNITDLYCKFKVGHHSGKSVKAKSQDFHAEWKDVVTLERNKFEDFARIKVKSTDKRGLPSLIGAAQIDIKPILCNKKISQWVPLIYDHQITGKILLEIEYAPIPSQ